MTKCKKDRWHV